MKSFLKYWLPVLIWLGVIFIGSSDLMSAEHTSRIIEPFLRWLRPDISPEAIAQIQFVVRKAAHVTEYAILAMLLWRALRGGWRSITSTSRSTIMISTMAWVGSTIVATADEYHQAFIASRSSSPMDVMIDSAGAIVGLLIWSAVTRRQKHRKL